MAQLTQPNQQAVNFGLLSPTSAFISPIWEYAEFSLSFSLSYSLTASQQAMLHSTSITKMLIWLSNSTSYYTRDAS